MSEYILVIDEGTTSTRAIVFDGAFQQVAIAQEEVALHFPQDGWVEQDGEEIWSHTLAVCRRAIEEIGGVDHIAGIGITNQRETTLVWDRATLKPIAPAIVWQDRRTARICEELRAADHEAAVRAETGLLLDPYFSATKIAWLLDTFPHARGKAMSSDLAFGTVDSFLIAKLTGGRTHAIDATNASRTLLARLGFGDAGGWSEGLADLFDVPLAMLPEIRPSRADYGETSADLFGRPLPILSAIGDQQAALVGQGCLSPGQAKVTFGTGAFLVANTGEEQRLSAHKLLGTIGVDLGGAGAFALEGSIFNAGTVVKWLRDELQLITDAADTEALAANLPDNGGVYFVPAFTGLGAPHWDADARGQITGLTRGTRAAHIVRAGLEAAAYQTRDLLNAFKADGAGVSLLRVDGGMAANDWLMQFIADICDVSVERPDYTEMTALGAAALAGMELGWTSPAEWAGRDRAARRFDPAMRAVHRDTYIAGWNKAVQSVLSD
ncbi:MAG: glycerol kinase GlpK [Pseudomonadota bacterium]